MIGTEQVELITLAGLLGLAVIVDLRAHRIPNWLTGPGIPLAMLLAALSQGPAGIAESLAGLAVGLVALLPFYVTRAMGAGDIKLLAMIGAFLGPGPTLLAAGMTLLVGAVMGVVVLAARRGVGELTRRYACIAWSTLTMRRLTYLPPPPGTAAASRFPYALAIAAGTLSALLWAS